ncbi:MAG: dihydrofolate reductase [SAR324 cluster bacterium]|nr:dihydrofolate reductase [SAR324 cluster bacterium]
MSKLILSVFIATSIDGFIAREDASLDWLETANSSVPEGEDCGFHAFFSSVDILVMGRNTYEKVLSFGEWPYREKPVIVLSSRALEIPPDLRKMVEHSSETPEKLYKRLSEKGLNRLYIDGGDTIRRFLEAGLIHDLTITVIPVIIGKGLSLFGGLKRDVSLKHISSKIYDFGFIQSSFQVIQ